MPTRARPAHPELQPARRPRCQLDRVCVGGGLRRSAAGDGLQQPDLQYPRRHHPEPRRPDVGRRELGRRRHGGGSGSPARSSICPTAATSSPSTRSARVSAPSTRRSSTRSRTRSNEFLTVDRVAPGLRLQRRTRPVDRLPEHDRLRLPRPAGDPGGEGAVHAEPRAQLRAQHERALLVGRRHPSAGRLRPERLRQPRTSPVCSASAAGRATIDYVAIDTNRARQR